MGKPKAAASAAQQAPAADDARDAVEERGEIALNLGGQELVMRPTYEATASFEQVTGKGLLQLAREALSGTLSLPEAAQVAAECIKAFGRAEKTSAAAVSAERVAELMYEAQGGYREALKTLAGMLALATTGGYTAQGKPKPTTTTKTTDGAPVVG